MTTTNEITVEAQAAQLDRHGLAVKRKRSSLARHPPGQDCQDVVDGAPTLVQQRVAEQLSLFRRERTNKRVEHGIVRGFQEETLLRNQPLRN